MSIIKLSQVSKFYKFGKKHQFCAVDRATFGVKKNEFIAIIGKSGSGKSTLLNMLGLLDKPTHGKYLLNGCDVSRISDRRAAHIRSDVIGFVFQSFNLLTRASALENVLLPTTYHKINERKSKAMTLLKKVGLKGKEKQRIDELSGGERQRVAIARSLMNDPDIILADEPTGNLDTKTGREIMNLLRELNKQGKTIILVTHDLVLTRGVDRVVKIEDGKIVK